MDSDNTFLNHKLKKLQIFINNEQISFNDLNDISYNINTEHKCNICYNEFTQYNEIKDLFHSFSKKINKSLKETILILEKKGIVNSDLVKTYKKYKKRFVNGIFDYCHHNTLISFKKLEQLLKRKNIKDYNIIFENIKYNCDDFYCCPHYKRPERKKKLNISDFITNLPNKNVIKNEEKGEQKEFVNDIIYDNIKSEPIIWENKKTSYKRNPIKLKIKKEKNSINKELEIVYSPFLKDEVQNLLFDLNYSQDKEKLIDEMEKLENLTNFYPENIILYHNLFKIQRTIENNYFDLYSSNSHKIHDSIINLINKHINIFNNEEEEYDFSNIYDKDKLISIIKDTKFNINYGKEIIDSCNLVKNIKTFKITVDEKINYYKRTGNTLIKRYNKIVSKKENIDDT
jgi:hypothetical protein